jgi:hypothetical protein
VIPAHVVHARALIGTRWSHRGRSNRRIDCVGLVVVSLTRAGVTVQDRLLYGRDPNQDRLRDALVDEFGPAIPKAKAQVGDIALLRGFVYPLHVGILGDYAYGGLSLIHANNAPTVMKVCEQRLAGDMFDRLLEVYRPEVPCGA